MTNMIGEKNQNSIAILIPSCDRYYDVWEVLLQGYKKFRIDCPYKKYLITNGSKIPSSEFINVNVGVDVDRSTNCINALDQIDSDYILMHIDDLIFNSSIDSKIYKHIDVFIAKKGNYLQLLNLKGGKFDEMIHEKKIDEPYRTSTIFSLWKKEILVDLLRRGESPRQFEIEGTSRSKKYDKRYFLTHNYFSFENLIIKGNIDRFSLNRLHQLGISYSGVRKKMSLLNNVKYIIKCYIFDLILLLPNSIGSGVTRFIRSLG